MLDLAFDDRYWSAALAVLRDPKDDALAAGWPDYAGLLRALAAEAREGGALVGVRVAAEGDNPRLWALLSAALLARAGARTLFVDPSPGVRWLERVTGRDLKEGIVDHLAYDVPLERCVRSSGIPGLEILSGGAHFLTGSPLDDAPAFRATLDRLRSTRDAVVVVLPEGSPSDATGIPALCDALVTVEQAGRTAPLAGSERAVVRLTGDPAAAADLERLATRFVGPLAVLTGETGGTEPAAGGPGHAEPVAGPGRVGPVEEPGEEAENVAFLRDMFDQRARERAAAREWEAARAARAAERSPGPEKPADPLRDPRSGAWRGALAVTVVAVLALLALGVATGRIDLPGMVDDGRPGLALVKPEPVPVDPSFAEPPLGRAPEVLGEPVDSTDLAADPADPAAAEDSAAAGVPPGEPVPWSVHVGSYQVEDSGARLVDRLAEGGYTAFLAPVAIPGKGRWHRVFVGVYPDSAAARGALDRLLDGGLVEEGVVRAVPYAFLLGAFPTRSEAERQRRDLARAGIPAYVAGDDPVRLYAGAYTTEDEALLLARNLETARESARLTVRQQ